MKNIAQKFAVLAPREQIAVVICGIFLLSVLIWVLLLAPAYGYYSDAKNRLEDSLELSIWIEQNRSGFESIAEAQSEATDEDLNLLQLVSQEAERQEIQISRIEPTFDDMVRSTYSGVNFSSLLALIQSIESTGAVIESVNIDSTTAPGFVNASLVVKR